MPPTPTRPAAPPPVPLSPAAQGVGWGVFGAIAFVGFCFGVWAGTQRPPRPKAAPPEAAEARPESAPATKPADPKPADSPPPAPPAPPAPVAKAEPPAPPPPATKPAEPTKKAEPMKKAEPPKKKAEPAPAAVANNVTFAKDVMPIFRTHCLNCHGNVGKPKGNLDLRTLAAIMKNDDALTPGNPAKSTIWTQIEDGDMPPPDKPKMTAEEKKTVKDWIAGGAKP